MPPLRREKGVIMKEKLGVMAWAEHLASNADPQVLDDLQKTQWVLKTKPMTSAEAKKIWGQS